MFKIPICGRLPSKPTHSKGGDEKQFSSLNFSKRILVQMLTKTLEEGLLCDK
jgi:hypothetical protein